MKKLLFDILNEILLRCYVLIDRSLIVEKQRYYFGQSQYVKYNSLEYEVINEVGVKTEFEFVDDFFKNGVNTSSSFFEVLDNAEIIGDIGIVVSGRKIWLSSICESKGYLLSSNVAKDILLKGNHTSQKVDIALSLVNIFASNYYHWINDVLPLLRAYFDYRDRFEILPKILIPNYEEGSFQLQYLKLLEIPDEQIVVMSSKRVLCDKLIVPCIPYDVVKKDDLWNEIHFLKKENYDWLRAKLLSIYTPKTKRNLLVIRNTKGRKILNLAEVTAQLKQFGFDIVDMQNESVSKQIELFLNAKTLITAHGAGLTNMLFSKSLNLIELYPKERKRLHTSVFFQISSWYGFAHKVLICESDNDENLIVNVKFLLEIYKKFEGQI